MYSEALLAVKSGNIARARRYVELALKVVNKANVKTPRYLRRGVCRNCLTPSIPGITARYRIRGLRKYVIISRTCLICGWVSRLQCRKRK
ncbi:MAG: RNAse P, Rpr2/Rpp21 subunit [Sulfolobales archaeon]